MGTTLRIGVAASARSAGIEAIEVAFKAVRSAESVLSTWRDDSEIAQVNHAQPGQAVALSHQLSAALLEADHWCRETRGAFDPAVGALVDAWELRGAGRVPSWAALSRARSATGMRRFAFSSQGRRVSRTHPSAWIDTGGFGKGLALRDAREALRRTGIASARLNFGGQVVVIGADHQGNDWLIPVAHPSQRAQPVAWLHLRRGSISTSSQSERFVTADGRAIGHVLDPRTGQPVPAWGSVSVVADDPTVADVVSTALLVLGPDSGLQWARARADIGVLFLVEHEGRLERRWNEAFEKFQVPDSTTQRRT
jgi:thiamine biosynthesis lipoprotein